MTPEHTFISKHPFGIFCEKCGWRKDADGIPDTCSEKYVKKLDRNLPPDSLVIAALFSPDKAHLDRIEAKLDQLLATQPTNDHEPH